MSKEIKYLIIVTIGFIYTFLTVTVVSFYNAETSHTQGKKELYSGYVSLAQAHVEEAVSKNPYEPGYHRTLATTQLAKTLAPQLSIEEKRLAKDKALEEAQKAYELQPHNLVNLKNLIPIYYFLGVKEINESANPQIDQTYIQKTLEFYEIVETEAPTDASTHLLLAKQYEALNEKEQARRLYAKALKLKPDLQEAQEKLKAL